MSKKLLSEAQIRRFAKLASLEPISERWGSKKGEYKRQDVGGVEKKAGDVGGHYKDYEKKEGLQEETPFDDVEAEVDTALPPGEEVEMAPGEEEIEMDAGPGEEIEMEADLGDPEQVATEIFTAIADVLGVEIDVGGDVGDLGGEEVMDDTEMVGDEGSLEGEDTEIVEAQRAEKKLQKALGTKRTRTEKRRSIKK